MGITEVFDHVSHDGSKDFERVIGICREIGDYCLIGGLAINCLEDIIRGKTWAWQDSAHRLSKREKDRLDLIRIGECHPAMRHLLPQQIQTLLKS